MPASFPSVPGAAKLLFVLATVMAAGAPRAQSQATQDLRLRQLENEVLRLQRELDTQARRIEALERAARKPGTPSLPPSLSLRTQDDSPAWLIATNWDRIRPGMKELDVIALLGRPTSARADDNGVGRTFFYALELGPNAILAGNVRFDASGVTQVTRPALK